MCKHDVIRRLVASGVVIAAAGLPAAAQARFVVDPPVAPPANSPALAASGLSAPRTPAGSQPGFHWDDAGIGAGGAVLLLGAGVAGSGLARRNRRHRTVVG